MAKMSKETIDLFRDPESSKMLATIDANGMPNMAPKGSLIALNEGILAFAAKSEGKTIDNLTVNGKVAAAAFKATTGCQVKGTFQGFQVGGPQFEQFAAAIKATGIPARWMSNVEAVGIIEVQED
jgi:hypothetical protein